MADATAERRDYIAEKGAAVIARVYAEALLNVAARRNRCDDIYLQLDAVVQNLFRTMPQLQGFLSSRAIRKDAKDRVIRKAFEGKVDTEFLDFLLVLNRHDRLDLLPAVWQTYREMNDRRGRRMRVRVRTAIALPTEQRDALIRELHETFQLEPLMEERVDPDLLGGLIVQVGDWVFDGSVRTRLERLRSHLLTRSNHEIESRRDRFCN